MVALEYARTHKLLKEGQFFKFGGFYWHTEMDVENPDELTVVPWQEKISDDTEGPNYQTFPMVFRDLKRNEINALSFLSETCVFFLSIILFNLIHPF